MKRIFYLLGAIILTSCVNNDSKELKDLVDSIAENMEDSYIEPLERGKEKNLKSSYWKYGSGYHIKDVLILTDDNLSNDTIYIDGNPKAVVIQFTKRILADDILIISSIETGEQGEYFHKKRI